MRERLGANPVPTHLPIGAEEKFEGVVDLLNMKAIYWDSTNFGVTYEAREIPVGMENLCKQWRETLIEAAAEGDEDLMEKYFENGDLSSDEILRGIRARTLRNEIVPALCGSAFKNKGVQVLLDAVICYLPAPDDVRRYEVSSRTETTGARHGSRMTMLRSRRLRSRLRPRSVCGKPHFLPCLFRRAEIRGHRLQPGEGSYATDRAYLADAREQPGRDHGGARRRHRGGSVASRRSPPVRRFAIRSTGSRWNGWNFPSR